LYDWFVEQILSPVFFFCSLYLSDWKKMPRTGFYATLEAIRPREWFQYAVVVVAVFFIVTRIVRPTAMQLVAAVLAAIIVFYRVDRRNTTTERAYTELEYRLKELYPKPENFHMDADILNFYYNMKDFRKYHSEGYDESLVAVDNMLKIISEMEAGVYHCKDNLDIVKDQMNKALNHFQAIIFKLPSDVEVQRRHKRALNALHIVLRRHVDDMVKLCQDQMGGSPKEIDRHRMKNRATEFYPSAGYTPSGALEERGINIDWHPIYNSGPRPNDLNNLESSDFDFYY
jgi:hypothetical protein